MTRAVLAYLILVLLPAAALAVFAFRAAEWDHRTRLEEHASRARDEAEALARRLEGEIAAAARRAEAGAEDADGFARDGRWIAYAPDPQAGTEPNASSDELKYYELSLRGGESYEHGRRDPARAIDAYAFYLPRIRSPLLRARLELGAARSALAAGETALGVEMLRRLFAGAEGIPTAEGLPVDLLAAARLLELEPAPPGAENLRGEARDRLRRAGRSLATPLLARLASAFAPGDEAMREMVARRRALEAAVAAHPEILASADAVLGGGYLLLARPRGDARGSAPLREVRLAPLELPPIAAGELEARLEPPASTGAGAPEKPGRVERPIHLGESGPVLALLLVEDPRLSEKLAAADRRRDLLRALVGLLVLVTLSGGAALAAYLSRERRVARLRSRLLANVSHELKTPVTSIRMFSEMLAEDPGDAGQARRFGKLLSAESARLAQLVENLLDFSRLGRRDEVLAAEPVDIAALTGRIAEGFSLRAREAQVELRLEGIPSGEGPAASVIVPTNPQAAERILLNLLDNALKYRRAEKPEVRLSLEEDAESVRVSVADNGIGIPRRDRERVFEEFYRVRYDDYAVKGSGLGLSIARRLARKLGGDVTLESREGEGSTFTLVLPRSGPEDDARPDPDR